MVNEYEPLYSKREVAGIRGFNLDAYLVALEGWRRGLKLKWYYDFSPYTDLKPIGFNPIGKGFSLSSDEKTHYFFRSRGDKVDNVAVDICQNKAKTKLYLEKNNIPILKGYVFSRDLNDDELVKEANKIGYPLVLKPTQGSLGKGVFTNIKNETELLQSLATLRKEYDYDEYMIEQFFPGKEYRVYVVGDEVVAVSNRVPAYIVGNGVNTIEELIKRKNQEKKKNPYLRTKLIKVDFDILNNLKRNKLNLDSVPKKDEVIYLRNKSNVSAGGEPVDATDEISKAVKDVAVNTLKALPGLPHAGIDIIVDANNSDRCVVLEVNATAEISMHIFPVSGAPRNIPKAIIDYYFPETKNIETNNLYFDYKTINKLLRDKAINEVQVTQAPVGKLYTKRLIVSGIVQGVGYRNWVKKRALSYNLTGYVRNLDNGNVVIIVAGTDNEILEKFKEDCYIGPERAKVENIKELGWDKALKVGFEIKRKDKNDEIKELKGNLKKEEQKVKQLKEENNTLNKENKTINKKYKDVITSRSWKVTAPLRWIANKIT